MNASIVDHSASQIMIGTVDGEHFQPDIEFELSSRSSGGPIGCIRNNWLLEYLQIA
jgi:hypothetical protein